MAGPFYYSVDYNCEHDLFVMVFMALVFYDFCVLWFSCFMVFVFYGFRVLWL